MIKGKKIRSLMALHFSGTTANVNKFICAAASRMHLNDRLTATLSNCRPEIGEHFISQISLFAIISEGKWCRKLTLKSRSCWKKKVNEAVDTAG
jgi:hypothetical protein